MTSVVVYGQKPDYPARLLAELLSVYGGVGLHTSDSLQAVGEGTLRFSVRATSRLERLMLPGSVLLLADQSAPRRLEMLTDTVVVAGADNRRLRKLLKGRSNPLVTCGMGLRDTVTLSSTAEERVLICVQRELPTADGRWIDPFECILSTNGCGIRSALLIAGAAAVCGCDLSRCETGIGL